jgi:hypothetical protein
MMRSGGDREFDKIGTSARQDGSTRARVWRLVLAATGLGALATLAVALAPSGAAAAACALSIMNCGSTISSPGNYTLSGPSPMNSTGTCIDITASRVTLSGSGTGIKGPGSATPTIGVHIGPTANRVILENILAEGFGQGIRVDGPNASTFFIETTGNNRGTVVNGANAFLIEEISFMDNVAGIQVNATATDFVMVAGEGIDDAGVGIKLNGVSGAFIDDAIGDDDGTFGIWLKSASNNVMSGFQPRTTVLRASTWDATRPARTARPALPACPPATATLSWALCTGRRAVS